MLLFDVMCQCVFFPTSISRSLRSELDEAKSEILVTGCVRENLVELERQKEAKEEEVETMTQLLQERNKDQFNSHRFHSVPICRFSYFFGAEGAVYS
jgi:rRNA-processing protein FCF1